MPEKLVATREGGVDRNVIYCVPVSYRKRSPPARVAWIETTRTRCTSSTRTSPPARVAWIETYNYGRFGYTRGVATREGGVDRNFLVMVDMLLHFKSPPARVAWIETG